MKEALRDISRLPLFHPEDYDAPREVDRAHGKVTENGPRIVEYKRGSEEIFFCSACGVNTTRRTSIQNHVTSSYTRTRLTCADRGKCIYRPIKHIFVDGVPKIVQRGRQGDVTSSESRKRSSDEVDASSLSPDDDEDEDYGRVRVPQSPAKRQKVDDDTRARAQKTTTQHSVTSVTSVTPQTIRYRDTDHHAPGPFEIQLVESGALGLGMADMDESGSVDSVDSADSDHGPNTSVLDLSIDPNLLHDIDAVAMDQEEKEEEEEEQQQQQQQQPTPEDPFRVLENFLHETNKTRADKAAYMHVALGSSIPASCESLVATFTSFMWSKSNMIKATEPRDYYDRLSFFAETAKIVAFTCDTLRRLDQGIMHVHALIEQKQRIKNILQDIKARLTAWEDDNDDIAMSNLRKELDSLPNLIPAPNETSNIPDLPVLNTVLVNMTIWRYIVYWDLLANMYDFCEAASDMARECVTDAFQKMTFTELSSVQCCLCHCPLSKVQTMLRHTWVPSEVVNMPKPDDRSCISCALFEWCQTPVLDHTFPRVQRAIPHDSVDIIRSLQQGEVETSLNILKTMEPNIYYTIYPELIMMPL